MNTLTTSTYRVSLGFPMLDKNNNWGLARSMMEKLKSSTGNGDYSFLNIMVLLGSTVRHLLKLVWISMITHP